MEYVMASRTPASENSGRTTGDGPDDRQSALVPAGRHRAGRHHESRPLGRHVPGRAAATGSGRAATSGAALGWVARAGVDVRARRTGVRLRRRLRGGAGRLRGVAAVLRLVPVRCRRAALVVPLVALPTGGGLGRAPTLDLRARPRLVERTDPWLFFRDAAAFNCFPLCWNVAPALEQDAQELPGSAFSASILAERVTADPTLFIRPIHNCGPGIYARPKAFLKRRVAETAKGTSLPRNICAHSEPGRAG